jgi:uncharacterized protein YndB with AHSA1/START domain
MTTTQTSLGTQIHRVWINASAQAVWDAIVDTEWNGRYGYGAAGSYDLHPGGRYTVKATAEMLEFGAPELMIEGDVLEVDPPHRLVQTWHALFDESTTAEPPTRLTWELLERDGATRLTVTHELAEAPTSAVYTAGEAENAGGGWPYILSDLKTLLETGRTIAGSPA